MAAVGPWVACLGSREATIFGAACPITLKRFQGGPIMLRSAKNLNNLTLEQSGHSKEALMATVGPWVACLGPREATIFGAARPVTSKRFWRGPIMLRSAKNLNNLTLEQNRRS